jgi:toxin ParE1/3/4
MTKEVIIEPEAAEDLRAAAEYYERREPGSGISFYAMIAKVFATLPTAIGVTVPNVPMPARFQEQLRRIVIDAPPYAIIYAKTDTAVHVLAVAHAKKRPEYWLERLRRLPR